MIRKNVFTSKLKNKLRPFNGFITEYVKLKSKWGNIYDISYQHFSSMLFWGCHSIHYMVEPKSAGSIETFLIRMSCHEPLHQMKAVGANVGSD